MKYLLLAFLLFSSSTLFAQNAYLPYNAYSAGEVNIAAKRGEFMPSASFNNFTGGQFKFGLSFRLTSFIGKNKTYITAPAILTSGKTGPGVFFADQIIENIDTIIINRPKGHSINVGVLLEYRFNQNWAAGFNIDVLGVTLGGQTSGKYQDLNQQNVTTKPSTFNLLLTSDNDRGSLNSELYAKYFMKNNPYYFKAGASFYFNEQTTLKKQRLNNDRFRYKSLAPVIGAGFLLNNPLF